MKTFGGKVLFLDRDDINTDEIIPAKYLTENAKETLKPHILEDLKLPGFDPQKVFGSDSCGGGTCSLGSAGGFGGIGAIVSRNNFGCGSSREHAPWVLELNGVNMVIAGSFARIFRQNMYNCGLVAAEIPPDVLDRLFRQFAGKETVLAAALAEGAASLTFTAGGTAETVPLVLTGFERALVEAGGWVEYANCHY